MKKSAILFLLFVLAAALPAFAVANATLRALEAFRRYEPDFANSLRRLEELDRRLSSRDLQPGSSDYERITEDAGEIMDFIQRRYDILEDLYKSVSGDYPEDRPQLMNGFARVEDLYIANRDFHNEKFVERVYEPAKERQKEPAKTVEPVDTSATEYESDLPQIPEGKSDASSVSTGEYAESQERRVRLHGNLKFDWRNRNEEYTSLDTAVPNNLGQVRLGLQYEIDQQRMLALDEKYLRRRRNEPVRENQLSLAYIYKHSHTHTYTLKDTLTHVWYPDNTAKDYRNNLAEAFWLYRKGKWERLTNLGFETRDYPNYSRSDYRQLNYGGQTTYFVPNGIIFFESKYNWRSYPDSPMLDYTNANYYGEFNRAYLGNKSEISISNTYDKRTHGNEAVNLFRASYWDNYFRFKYELPVSRTFTWIFEDDWQKRNYASDFPRGYAELKLKTTARINIDDKTRGRFAHTYIFNDENTKARAHYNHIFNAFWEKKFSDSFRLRLEDTFHRRHSLIGDVMDFKENDIRAMATWRLPSKILLSAKLNYLSRVYNALVYPDFKYWLGGLEASYSKPKCYDWQLEQSFRRFSFRNGNNLLTDWVSRSQPISSVKINFVLTDDLKLRLSALREKTYYRTFDTLSQELLWDFTRPMIVTEFYGGLEYSF